MVSRWPQIDVWPAVTYKLEAIVIINIVSRALCLVGAVVCELVFRRSCGVAGRRGGQCSRVLRGRSWVIVGIGATRHGRVHLDS